MPEKWKDNGDTPREDPWHMEIVLMGLHLPPIIKGVAELDYWTELGMDFIGKHSAGAVGRTPSMPSFFVDGKRLYPARLVMKWLYKWCPEQAAVQMRKARIRDEERRRGRAAPPYSEEVECAVEEGGTLPARAGWHEGCLDETDMRTQRNKTTGLSAPTPEVKMIEHGIQHPDGRPVRSLPRPSPPREDAELMMPGLPPIMKGMAELHYWTGLGLDFIRRHSTGAVGRVPMLPNFFADGKRGYPSGPVLRWLWMWWPGDAAVQPRRGNHGGKRKRRDDEPTE